MTTLDSERRLNIALVGHGRLEIPPKAWGAVEEVIWKYACHLQARGHTTPIINERWHKVPRHLIREHRKKPLDWVWVHNEKAIFGALVASKICGFRVVATSHSPYDPFGPQTPLVRKQFGRLKRAPYHLTLTRDQGFAVSVMRPAGRYALQYNGTDVKGIEFRNSPGNGRAICLGQVSVRKRQSLVAQLVKGTEAIVDFVGPNDLEPLPVSLPSQFLGEWSRGELSQNLTDYSAMVLYSRAEAHAMVVMEGLAAGLSVVVSPQSAANLDLSRPFIYVVDKDTDLASTIEKAVAENPAFRAQARTYAEEHFAWPARATTLESHLLGWDAD